MFYDIDTTFNLNDFYVSKLAFRHTVYGLKHHLITCSIYDPQAEVVHKPGICRKHETSLSRTNQTMLPNHS